jgi:DNA-binding transcriptional regulator YiaG
MKTAKSSQPKPLGEELIESVREAGAVMRGEKPASRVWKLTKMPDGTFKRVRVSAALHQKQQATRWAERTEAAQARDALALSQTEFASLLGISIRTLHQWEQGRRQPTGAARMLLKIARLQPKLLKRVIAM